MHPEVVVGAANRRTVVVAVAAGVVDRKWVAVGVVGIGHLGLDGKPGVEAVGQSHRVTLVPGDIVAWGLRDNQHLIMLFMSETSKHESNAPDARQAPDLARKERETRDNW